jgi:CDP-paratose 2-epimerase
MLEAIELCQEISGQRLDFVVSDQARIGDHRWWISDLSAFEADYPGFRVTTGIREVLEQIHAANADDWLALSG